MVGSAAFPACSELSLSPLVWAKFAIIDSHNHDLNINSQKETLLTLWIGPHLDATLLKLAILIIILLQFNI